MACIIRAEYLGANSNRLIPVRGRRDAGAFHLARPVWLMGLSLFLSGGPILAQAAGNPAPVHELDGSFIREWLVLGPFPSRDLETDFLAGVGGEANVRPKEGDTVTTQEGKRLVWTRLRSKGDLVNLDELLGFQEWSIAYTYCELHSEQSIESDAQSVSSPSAPFWLNGKKVGQTPTRPTRRDDSTPVLPLHLNAGRNSCLLKVKVEPRQPWTFAFQPLPSDRAAVELQVADPRRHVVPKALVQVYDQGKPVARIQTDDSGKAVLCFYPLAGSYDLRITSGDLGAWWYALALRPGEWRKLEVVLTNTVSISGRVLAMDGSPQSAIVVQALRILDNDASNPPARTPRPSLADLASGPQLNPADDTSVRRVERVPADRGEVHSLLPMPPFSETVLSDTNGNFRFMNLRPGHFRLRAHGAHGYVYPVGERNQPIASQGILVEPGQLHNGTDFVFPEAKKGVWTRYPVRDGLADRAPASILRTPDGMLWVGTYQGTLHAYDGVEFKTFSGPPTSGGYYRAVKRDASGTLWIGTEMGICRFLNGTIQNVTFTETLPSKEVGSIETDPDGTVWFGTLSGLCQYDGRQWTRWSPQQGIPSGEIGALLRARSGELWMSTPRSLARFDGRNFSEPVRLSGLRQPTLERLHQARDGALWFCSPRHETAVYRYDGATLSRLGEEEGLPTDRIYAIAETSDGVLWFGTPKGLTRFDGTTILNYTPADGLSDADVGDIFVDSEDVLWCACHTGISRFDPKGFAGVTLRDGLVNKFAKTPGIFAIEPDTDGGYLLGTEWGGVYHLGAQDRQLSTNAILLPNAYVRRIHRTADGTLWFGTSDGIYRQTDQGIIKVLDRNWVIALISDDQGNLWFGQAWFGGGVSRFNPITTEETVFTRLQGLPDDYVWTLERGLDGSVWIGTRAGLARFRGGKIENLGAKLGLGSGPVLSLRRDAAGALWIGGDAGLHRLSGTNLVSLTAANGPPVERVSCSARTEDGIIWMGTDKQGLLGFDGQAFTAIDKRDGLLGNQVIVLRPDADGSLLVGLADGGLSWYQRTKTTPSVRLLELKLDDRAFSQFANLPATETGKRVSVQYQEIDLKTHPEKRQFKYRVQGPAGETLFAGITKDRRFEWTPRQGGAYAFAVQAIDRDLNYSLPARFTIRARVPWYANVWILAPGGALFGGLAIWAVVARALYMRKSRETVRLRERARIARDLHDHLGSELTHLALLSDFVHQQNDQTDSARALAARLSESAHDLTRTMGEVIWTTDPAKDTLRSFVSFLSSYAERFFAQSDLRLRLNFPAQLPEVPLPAALRHSLFMVAKEALNNAAKHAQASEVRIHLDLSGHELRLSIEDNGKGFVKTPAAADHNGLANMEKRLRELGGEFVIETAVGRGTRVYARLPLPKN